MSGDPGLIQQPTTSDPNFITTENPVQKQQMNASAMGPSMNRNNQMPMSLSSWTTTTSQCPILLAWTQRARTDAGASGTDLQ